MILKGRRCISENIEPENPLLSIERLNHFYKPIYLLKKIQQLDDEDIEKEEVNLEWLFKAQLDIKHHFIEEHQYDETLSGLEDLEWACWVIEQGLAIAYVAEAEIIHVHEETPMGIYNRYLREAMAFKRLFPQERFNFVDFLRLFSSNVASDMSVALREGIFSQELKGILWFRFMQFWGTYQGYRRSGPLTWELRQTFYYPVNAKSMSEQQPRSVKPIQYNDIN